MPKRAAQSSPDAKKAKTDYRLHLHCKNDEHTLLVKQINGHLAVYQESVEFFQNTEVIIGADFQFHCFNVAKGKLFKSGFLMHIPESVTGIPCPDLTLGGMADFLEILSDEYFSSVLQKLHAFVAETTVTITRVRAACLDLLEFLPHQFQIESTKPIPPNSMPFDIRTKVKLGNELYYEDFAKLFKTFIKIIKEY